MRYLVPLVCLLLAACASAFEPPVVDTTGHEKTYLADQSECVKSVQDNYKGFSVGQPVTDCMRNKGYTILVPKG